MAICKKSVPGRGSCRCIGPEEKACLECLKKSKATSRVVWSRVVQRYVVRISVKLGIADL